MLLKRCTISFYSTVYAVLSQILKGRNFWVKFWVEKPRWCKQFTFSMSAYTVQYCTVNCTVHRRSNRADKVCYSATVLSAPQSVYVNRCDRCGRLFAQIIHYTALFCTASSWQEKFNIQLWVCKGLQFPNGWSQHWEGLLPKGIPCLFNRPCLPRAVLHIAL